MKDFDDGLHVVTVVEYRLPKTDPALRALLRVLTCGIFHRVGRGAIVHLLISVPESNRECVRVGPDVILKGRKHGVAGYPVVELRRDVNVHTRWSLHVIQAVADGAPGVRVLQVLVRSRNQRWVGRDLKYGPGERVLDITRPGLPVLFRAQHLEGAVLAVGLVLSGRSHCTRCS